MSSEIAVVFIEDNEQDLSRYSRILSEKDKIIVTPIPPPKHVDELQLSPTPDLVLIDYRLTQLQRSGDSVTYRGGTLANYVAEQLPETPLIILSTRDVFNLFPNYEEEIRSADYILFKSDVNKDPKVGRNFLITLARGFRELAKVEKASRTWQTLLQLLKADNLEDENLQRSSPPRIEQKEKWHVHGVSRWILKVLFEYPGIFYDSLYASAALGLREEDFLRDAVQHSFKDARYTGVFAEIKKLWWKNRLQKLAFRQIKNAGLDPILSENFRIAFEKTTGIKLEPSVCVFSGEENANTICHILRKPVKMKYTLGYLPDTRPESMDPARISFKAILEEDFDKHLLPSADAELLDSIRRKYGY